MTPHPQWHLGFYRLAWIIKWNHAGAKARAGFVKIAGLAGALAEMQYAPSIHKIIASYALIIYGLCLVPNSY